jgi:hypothetical protein
MFERDPKDLAATLSEMEKRSRERTNFNQVEAKQKFAEWISQDRRFDDLDPLRVAERVAHCRSNGAVFDIGSPELKRSQSRNRY